jgi:integrase
VREFLGRSAGEEDRHLALLTVLATTGIRRGEALGIRWTDLDLDAGQASIRQRLICVNHEVQFGSPKTAKGQRSVALDAGTVEALRSHRTRQLEVRLQIGDRWQDHDLVFCGIEGQPEHPEHVSAHFARRVRRWELPMMTPTVSATRGPRWLCSPVSTLVWCRSGSVTPTSASRSTPIRM